jgi:hypothetical protein
MKKMAAYAPIWKFTLGRGQEMPLVGQEKVHFGQVIRHGISCQMSDVRYQPFLTSDI